MFKEDTVWGTKSFLIRDTAVCWTLSTGLRISSHDDVQLHLLMIKFDQKYMWLCD